MASTQLDEHGSEESSLSPQQRSLSAPSSNLVDYLYTYGGLSIARDPHMSNPGNKCIPGIRVYTEDIRSGRRCRWWNWWWCNPNDKITNTDFASIWNAGDYPHPKISTLVLRWRDNRRVEYIWKECKDSDKIGQYNFQSWPGEDNAYSILNDIHSLDEHYERRLVDVPIAIRGPTLEYASVSMCGYGTSLEEISDCLGNYSGGIDMGLPGVGPEWEAFAFMNHQTDFLLGTDQDVVYVLKNDEDTSNRRCIISFAGSESLEGDVARLVAGNEGSTGYCGRQGVHIGVRNELWQITHNQDYQDVIKPALETCHEVTCVGHSLGGALCNVFTMCANQGHENLDQWDDEGMYDDYYSLIWNKPGTNIEPF